MSLSRAQQILAKRAQQEAQITDYDYRASWATVSGMEDCTSSKDSRLTDRHLDSLLAFFEAIFWRAVDAGSLQPSCNPRAVFRQRGFWAERNTKGDTSRDRFGEANLKPQISALERELADLGYGYSYLMAIQNHIPRKADGGLSLSAYLGALSRTVAAKKKKRSAESAGRV
jgi:hypothetical protein